MEAVIFSKKGKTVDKINIFGSALETKDSMKILGVTVDANLSWNKHINCLLKKSNQKLGVLSKICNLFSKITTAQFHVQFYYCFSCLVGRHYICLAEKTN